MPRAALLVVPLLLLSSLDRAEARPFGEPGQYIVTSDANFDLQRDTTSVEGEADVTSTDYSFRLAIDYTKFTNVTIGAQAGFDGTLFNRFDAVKRFGLLGRAGYIVPLSPSMSLWPRLGLGYASTTYQSATGQLTVSSVPVNVSLPVLFHPYPHVIAGLVPSVTHDISSKCGSDCEGPKVTGFGVHLLFGFWFE